MSNSTRIKDIEALLQEHGAASGPVARKLGPVADQQERLRRFGFKLSEDGKVVPIWEGQHRVSTRSAPKATE